MQPKAITILVALLRQGYCSVAALKDGKFSAEQVFIRCGKCEAPPIESVTMTTDTEVTRRRSMSSQFDLEYISLPISNEENKQLEEDVQLKKSEISTLQQQISEHNDRIQVLTEHLKNVQQELNLTQVRLGWSDWLFIYYILGSLRGSEKRCGNWKALNTSWYVTWNAPQFTHLTHEHRQQHSPMHHPYIFSCSRTWPFVPSRIEGIEGVVCLRISFHLIRLLIVCCLYSWEGRRKTQRWLPPAQIWAREIVWADECIREQPL